MSLVIAITARHTFPAKIQEKLISKPAFSSYPILKVH